jgi:hypothetical protein
MRGKMGLHYGLQRCNAQRAALACGGGGESGIPAADCRDACCRLSGILLPIVGMPAAVRGDAWNESC